MNYDNKAVKINDKREINEALFFFFFLCPWPLQYKETHELLGCESLFDV